MKLFHKTPAAESILKYGFRDGEGTYMTGIMHCGVWLSDRPLDFGQGANGDDLLLLEIPDDVLEPYEWIEDGKPCREFLVPADVVKRFGPPSLFDEDDHDWNGILTPDTMERDRNGVSDLRHQEQEVV